MKIGKRIKLRREELNITQDELAKALGYKSRSSVNKIELGENELTQKKIAILSEILNTTPSYIMGWQDETNATASDDLAVNKLSKNEKELIENYNKLNEEGQERLLVTSKELTDMDKYKKRDEYVLDKKQA